MNTRARMVGASVIAASAIVIGCIPGLSPLSAADDMGNVCLEDQPCWDCATMGNQVCGPVDHGLTHGARPGPDVPPL